MKEVGVVSLLLLFFVACNAQNTPPIFTSVSYNFEVLEESPPGSSVGSVEATDSDEGDLLTYTISTATATSIYFMINSSSGYISTSTTSIDRESGAILSSVVRIDVSVEDTQGLSASIPVLITIVDINDNAPTFQNLPHSFSINENFVVGSPVFQVQAQDRDVLRNAAIFYSILPNGTFSIDQSSGEITLIRTLDFDTGDRMFSLQIIAEDRAETGRQRSQSTLHITINDVNDQNPEFIPASYFVQVHENFTMGSTIVTVQARDQDEGINADILYVISSGNQLINGTPSFVINETTGEITVNVDNLDRETHSVYTLTIIGRENVENVVSARTASAQVVIRILDINDHVPIFDMLFYQVNISELTPINSTVLTLMASDLDQDVHARFDFAIATDDDVPFEVVADTIQNVGVAEILLTGDIDFERLSDYRFQVFATETVQEAAQSSFVEVIVYVTNENDNGPFFVGGIMPVNPEIDENRPSGSFIAAVSARDDDLGFFGELRFSLSDDDDGKPFTIETQPDGIGIINSTRPLNFEDVQDYTLTVIVEDLSPDLPRSNETSLNVTVRNLNDNPPVFVGGSGEPVDTIYRNVLEETPHPYTVLLLQATDRDGELNDLTYSIVSDSSNMGHFVIEDERELNTAIQLDFDLVTAVKSYTLNISVNDTTHVDFLTVNIQLLDINDNSPIFDNETYSFELVENTAADAVVGEVRATDSDSGTFGQIEYMLYGPADVTDSFRINSSTGEILLVATLDREETPGPLEFLVIASDLDSNVTQRSMGNTSVIITVLDQNDNSPMFSEAQYNFTVQENTAQLVQAFVVSAGDIDLDRNGVVTYEIVGGNEEAAFVILDSSNGVITRNVSVSLDFERTQMYVLNVSAEDLGTPSNLAFAEVVIEITDANDEFPTFTTQTFNASINENSPSDMSVATLSATDDDSGAFGRVTYLISDVQGPAGPEPNGSFVIDERTGVVRTVGNFDRELFEGPYFVTILVSDGGLPPNNGTASLLVYILDVNDETPVFETAEVLDPPEEELSPGLVVARFVATDRDEMGTNNSRVTYAITNITPILPSGVSSLRTEGHFALNVSNGVAELITNISLDYEEITGYEITITAADNGEGNLFSQTRVTIEVVDVNDNAPQFVFGVNSSRYTAELDEDLLVFGAVLEFLATDEDSTSNGQITYSPSNSSSFPDPPFFIESNQLFFIGNGLDFEYVSSYSFNVTASDGGDPSLSDEAQVEIIIRDVNDNPPIFHPTDEYLAEVDEGDYTVNSSMIVSVNATDRDSGSFGNVAFEVFPASDLFAVTNLYSGIGEIFVNDVLDRETLDQYTITILARDGAIPPNTATATVFITVNDINDNNPMLNEEVYRVTMREEMSIMESSDILRTLDISATDADLGNNGQIFYFLGNDTDFEIDMITGIVRSRRMFDYETEADRELVLDVIATDNGSYPLSDTAQIIISITDINDNSPFFIDFPVNVSYPEDLPVGSSIANITADDYDSGFNAELIFQLANDEGRFSIDNEGRITLSGSLDRESAGSYNITVTVLDRGQPQFSETNYLFIEVTDVNDVEPELERVSYNFLIPEDVQVNTTMGTIVAFDRDEDNNGVIEFEILTGDTNRFFLVTSQNIESNNIRQSYSARIMNSQLFDYENVTSYSLSVEARNIVPPYESRTADVTITIRDTNDNPPVFSIPEGYSITVPEAAITQRPVGTVVATDEDGGLNGTIRYRLSPDTPQAITNTYTIDAVTGVITLTTRLNFEEINHYNFYVEAFDQSVAPLTSNVSVTITVEDTNERAPQFDMTSYSASVRENLPPQNFVTRVNATEPETGNGLSVRYALESGSTEEFMIDSVTGIIRTRERLDRERTSNYVLTVQASDMATNAATAPLSSFVQVVIQVEDENDNDPTFDVTSAQVNLPESSPNGTRLPAVFLASDRDTGTNAEIRYSITPNSFVVDSMSGIISVLDSAVLDREAQSTFMLRLRATDRGSPSRAADLDIQVVLDDINDNTPLFDQAAYTARISEGSDVGVSVVRVNATDDDIEESLRYAIVSGDDENNQNKFRINEMSGLIETTANPLDRETRAFYELVVSVTDSGIPSRMSTTIVTVTVLDVNDNTPRCDRSLFAFSAAEANPLRLELGSVTATDGDNVTGLLPIGSGQLSYRLAPSTVVGIFSVSPMGVVFGEPGLDFDTPARGMYTFNVLATDQPTDVTRQRTATCSVMVTLSDENDNVPNFDESLYEATISEGADVGHIVLEVTAEDRDSGTNGDFTYGIQGSIDVFAIDPTSGIVTLTGSLDSDTNDLYEFEIGARDNGSPSRAGFARVRISVQDVDDTSPRFDRSFYQREVAEDAESGRIVSSFMARDPDSNVLRYSFLSGNEENTFAIELLSGNVRVVRGLDRESVPVYNLVIQALDPSFNFGTTRLQISVTDINDEMPEFEQSEYTAFINENSLEGTLVLPIRAIDNDQQNTVNSLVRYRLEGINAPRFNIDPSSGIVTVARGANLDYESGSNVPVTVVASDSHPTLPQSSSVLLSVNLIDVNDEPPRFTSPFGYIAILDEDEQVGSVVFSSISASDRDSVGGMIRYRLTDASPFSALSQFSINRTTGQLSLVDSLDRETDASITLEVTASDMGEPALSSVVNVRVTVRDVNDNSPRFDQDSYTITVPEFLAIGQSAIQVTAVDPDALGPNSEVRYEVMGTDTFTINPTTGDITTVATLDHETEPVHTFMVMACDNGMPRQCGTATVRINAGDFNDQRPTFDNSVYYTDICVSSAGSGTELMQPVATDEDSGSNAELTYSLEGSPSFVTVNGTTGRVSLNQTLNHMYIDSYTFDIVAQDRGDTPLQGSAQAVIRVQNCSEQNFFFDRPFYYFEIEEGLNTFTDGRGSLQLGLSSIPQEASFFPNPPTNPFRNILNDIRLKSFDDLQVDLRQGVGLDREARSLYTVTLRANTNQLDAFTFTSITLRVLDTNDNGPVFSSNFEAFQILENQTAPFPVGSVLAIDRDEGVNGNVEYSISSITPASDTPAFSVDRTGLINTEIRLDREEESQYEIVVEATDGLASDDITVRVTVQDVNDCNPTFIQPTYQVDISENLPRGSSVASVMAEDCDEGAAAILRYTIAGGSLGVFQLDLVSGVITTLAELDFEQTARYRLEVTATDMGLPVPLSGSADVFFNVLDFNDCPPEFVAPARAMTVPEDAAINSVVQTFTVQDCDSGLNGVNGTRFSIVTGNEEGIFEINAMSGVLRTIAPLDREDRSQYILSIQATDSAGINSLSSVTELTVTVSDVNDNSPVFTEDLISITVSEGEIVGRSLITVTATDEDSGTNGEISYFLDGGDETFDVDESTGSLSLARTLDRETNDSYVLAIVARDRATEFRFSNATIITVTVTDENDNDPEILNIISGVTTIPVAENSPIGTPIITLNATDPDEGSNANVRFSLDDRSTNLPFSLIGDLITVNGDLDFEQRVIYSLVVIAEDGGMPISRRGIATLIVRVTDMNDSPPDFIEDEYSGQQNENEDVGTEILRVQATDADQANTNNSLIAYYIDDSSPDSQFFTIDNMTGIISNAMLLDRERGDSYRFGVYAENYLTDEQLRGSAQVTIRINDVNDETPVFSAPLYTQTLQERTPVGTTVLTVMASDDDLANTPNSDLIFSLVQAANIPFFIDPNSGNLIVQSELDYEEQSFYQFNVAVEDKGTQPLRNTSTIRITITDRNDQVPTFSQRTYTAILPENAGPQQLSISSLRYNDGDTLPENTASRLSIVSISPPDNGLFSIRDRSGDVTISTNRPVDYETVREYTLTIMVQNNATGFGATCTNCRLGDTATVGLEIRDLNDNLPMFSRSEYNGEISSTALTGTSILAVTATDADATPEFRAIRYRLATNDNSPFRIGETTGTIFTRGSFEGLDGDVYTLNVFADDNDGVGDFNSAMTTVNLIVLNDFQRIAIIFNISVDVITAKQPEIVSLLEELTGYEIVVEQYREYSTDSMTSFIFHAVDNGNIIDFDDFLTGSLENELFVRLEECRILRIQSFGDLIVTQGPIDTETIVILVLCLFLIIGAIVVLITAFSQRYLALHAARHKLLADVFYGSHAGSSIVDNIHQENIQLQLLESSGQGTNKQNPMFVNPYDNWAPDTSGVESVGGDSNLQKGNELYESQEIQMQMFAEVSDEEGEEEDDADGAELLAAALQDDSDVEDEDNSVTAI